MIQDTATLDPNSRLTQRQQIQEWLAQTPALDLATEGFATLAAEELDTAVTQADTVAQKATSPERARRSMELVFAAAMARDFRYGVAGRKTLLAQGAHSAMLRAHCAGRASVIAGNR